MFSSVWCFLYAWCPNTREKSIAYKFPHEARFVQLRAQPKMDNLPCHPSCQWAVFSLVYPFPEGVALILASVLSHSLLWPNALSLKTRTGIQPRLQKFLRPSKPYHPRTVTPWFMPTLLGFSPLLAIGNFLSLLQAQLCIKKDDCHSVFLHVMIKFVHHCISQGKITEGDT